MPDKKKNSGKLTRVELKDVKGGIPYLKPDLIMLAGSSTSCTPGIHCDSGHNGGESCSSGLTCSSGTHGPNPDITPF